MSQPPPSTTATTTSDHHCNSPLFRCVIIYVIYCSSKRTSFLLLHASIFSNHHVVGTSIATPLELARPAYFVPVTRRNSPAPSVAPAPMLPPSSRTKLLCSTPSTTRNHHIHTCTLPRPLRSSSCHHRRAHVGTTTTAPRLLVRPAAANANAAATRLFLSCHRRCTMLDVTSYPKITY